MSNTREIGREDGEIGPNDQYDEWKRSDIPGRASALPVQQIPTGYDIPGRAGARQVQQIPTGYDIPGFAGALPVQQILYRL